MKTPLALIAAAALALCACESTTPAQRYAQSQQLVAQAYGNKLSQLNKPRLPPRCTGRPKPRALTSKPNPLPSPPKASKTRATSSLTLRGSRYRSMRNRQYKQLPVYQPPPMQNYQIDTPQSQMFNGASPVRFGIRNAEGPTRRRAGTAAGNIHETNINGYWRRSAFGNWHRVRGHKRTTGRV